MLRARDNLTQKQAGQLVGVTADTWANWENQKTFPDVQKIIEIEKAFNVNYDDIKFLGSITV
ncbi:TPA: helix-turn-helix transcriptional regulator [Streptococcus suis]|uniref:helix-turn-helix domain-containing protein n=2 Tax=Streptococcus TaxID=1301 RepID=UPI0006ACE6C8|nr:helix-turn-helix domain-containing protein [Streptococcus suis]HEM3232612.1 helix-turn-helix transcriptional regulator [Streptococcus suis 4961]MBY5036731.1 helix-turn-helix domain-containing protein [Streptococcus suis]MCK4019794.1 helix-turn-helix transcriptional regulator [Streptococcus suis]MCK4050575.1 helix-turn-helix transcriptional regulator [Streptococcus suis]